MGSKPGSSQAQSSSPDFYMDFSFERNHLGGHVGVDADGGEHGEVDEEVPAGKEHQGSRKSSEGEGQDDKPMA